METMNIRLFNRDFSASVPGRLDLRAERLTWSALGGPTAAWLRAETQDESWNIQAAQWALDALRRPVEISDQTGEKIWWGYVHRIEVQHSGFNLVYDLGGVANRVCVEYWQRVPQLEWTGVKTFTPWLDDLESQRVYGVKERVFRLGSLDESEALQTCSALLEKHGRPQPQFSESVNGGKEVRVRLECRGWWETISWRVARFVDGYEGHVRPAQLTQALGRNSSTDDRVAQSFQTAYGDWKAGEAVVNIRAVGMNNDTLRCELCVDAGGNPGSVLASSEVSGSVVSGARWWVKFVFSPRVPIEANTTYWLVLSRTGAASIVNYYQLYLDASNGYLNGKLMTWTGSAWVDSSSGLGDINFYVVGYVSRLGRLTGLAGASLGGQFLNGIKVKGTVSGDTLLWREGIRDCGSEMSDLLQAGGDGNALSAQVDADRRLVIEAVPGAEEWTFSLGSDGKLRTRSGRQAGAADQPAGQRVMLLNGWDDQRVILSALEWTPDGGLQVKW